MTTTNDDVNTVPAMQPLPQSLLLLLEALKTSQSDLAYIKSAARLLQEILGSNFPTARGIDFLTLRHNVISSWNTLLVEWSSIGIDALVSRLDFSEQLLLIELTLDAILSHTSRAVSANQHISLDVLIRVAGAHTASSFPTSLIPKELLIRLLWSTLHLYGVMDIGDVTNTMDCGGLLDLLKLQLMTLPTQSMNLPHVSSPSLSTITFESLNAFRHRFIDSTGLDTLGQV